MISFPLAYKIELRDVGMDSEVCISEEDKKGHFYGVRVGPADTNIDLSITYVLAAAAYGIKLKEALQP